MFVSILKFLIKLASSEVAREAITIGARKLVESTDNGIDDKIIDIFLDEAVKSKRNDLTKEAKDIIMKSLVKQK